MPQTRNGLDPTPFEPKAAGPDIWAMYHAFRRQRLRETRPDDPPMPDHVVEASMKRDDPFGEARRHLIIRDGQVVSSFYAGRVKPGAPGYDSNKHLVWIDAGVLTTERRQGIGRLWARLALDILNEWDATTLTTYAEEDDGHAFLRWLGADQKSTGAENRLLMAEVDWDMVDRWVAEGGAKSPESALVFYENRVPDEALEAFCPALSSMLNTMPFDDLDHGEIVITPDMVRERYTENAQTGAVEHTLLTREPDGTISSITDVHYQPARPDRIHQMFTGVRPDCRGRGLGKLIKASMLHRLRRAYPDARWVVTGNANSNDPMLAINRRLGFRTYRANVSYQITSDTLAERLAQV